MYEKFTSDFRQRSFDSLGEFYKYAIYDESHPECTNNKDVRFKPSSRDSDFGFSGTESWERAVELATNGWTDGLQELRYSVKDNKFIDGASNKFHMYNDVTGSFVDIDKYIRGEPECMLEFETRMVPRFATIFVSGSASACVGKEKIMRRGRKILEVVDALEQNNIRTRIVQIIGSTRGGSDDIITVVCKDYQNLLDMESLNFALCHASQLRRFAFSSWERAPTEWREKMGFTFSGGYGRPLNGIKETIQKIFPTDDEYIVFDSGVADYYEDIDEHVQKLITKGA